MNKKAIEGLVLLIVFVVAALGMGIALYSPGSPTGAVSLQQTCCDFNPNDPQSNCPIGECCISQSCGEGAFDGTCVTCPTTTTTATTGTTVTSFTTTSSTSTTTATIVFCPSTTTTTSTSTTSTTGTSTTTTGTATTSTTDTSTTTTTDTTIFTTTTTATTSSTTGTLLSQSNGDCCGDFIVNQPGEECDAGPGGGVSVDCAGSYLCTSACICEFCGDGITNDAEECDDGNNIDGDGCNANCQDEFCGDNIVQPGLGEQCEPVGGFAPGLEPGSICVDGAECLAGCLCNCDTDTDCDDDNACTGNVCLGIGIGCDFPPIGCAAKACASVFCDPDLGCVYTTNPDCRSGSGGGSGSKSGPVTCCQNPQFGNVVYDCECTILDHGNIRVQPNECCYNPESENCVDFCHVLAPASQGVPAGGYFTNLPTGSRSPSVGVQEPSAGVAQEAGSAQTARTFAEPERGSPIVSGATGAFDKNINTQGALLIGIILALALVTGIVIVVARRRG